MSRIDILTGKRANVGNARSHSNIATKRKQQVNLQRVKIGGVRVRVSTRTLRTLKKLTAILAAQKSQQKTPAPTKK